MSGRLFSTLSTKLAALMIASSDSLARPSGEHVCRPDGTFLGGGCGRRPTPACPSAWEQMDVSLACDSEMTLATDPGQPTAEVLVRGLVERVCDGRLDEARAAELALGRATFLLAHDVYLPLTPAIAAPVYEAIHEQEKSVYFGE